MVRLRQQNSSFLLLEASRIKRKIDGNSYLINRNLRWKYGIKQGILERLVISASFTADKILLCYNSLKY